MKQVQQGLPCVKKVKNTAKLLEPGNHSSEAENCKILFFVWKLIVLAKSGEHGSLL